MTNQREFNPRVELRTAVQNVGGSLFQLSLPNAPYPTSLAGSYSDLTQTVSTYNKLAGELGLDPIDLENMEAVGRVFETDRPRAKEVDRATEVVSGWVGKARSAPDVWVVIDPSTEQFLYYADRGCVLTS